MREMWRTLLGFCIKAGEEVVVVVVVGDGEGGGGQRLNSWARR